VAGHIDILIVEDRAVLRAMLREFLQSQSPRFSIGEAGSGRDALELVRECRPAVVLMDIGLPDANGIDLTAEIRKLAPGTQVIVVSQHAGEPYRERAHAAGAIAFLSKEKIYSELIPLVMRALREMPPSGIPSRCG
jgi:two-component system, NarL family, invasion response regulator UvrY